MDRDRERDEIDGIASDQRKIPTHRSRAYDGVGQLDFRWGDQALAPDGNALLGDFPINREQRKGTEHRIKRWLILRTYHFSGPQLNVGNRADGRFVIRIKLDGSLVATTQHIDEDIRIEENQAIRS